MNLNDIKNLVSQFGNKMPKAILLCGLPETVKEFLYIEHYNSRTNNPQLTAFHVKYDWVGEAVFRDWFAGLHYSQLNDAWKEEFANLKRDDSGVAEIYITQRPDTVVAFAKEAINANGWGDTKGGWRGKFDNGGTGMSEIDKETGDYAVVTIFKRGADNKVMYNIRNTYNHLYNIAIGNWEVRG